MNTLNAREIQLEELKILEKVVELFDKNNLNYFLCGGTFLGAIRHQGFIPWDDDIDIMMPRDDYEKLQKIIKKNNKLSKDLYFHSLDLKNLNFPFTKVYNHKIRIRDWRYNDKYEKYLWIDIFPVDGLPSDDEECIKIYKKKNFYKMFLVCKKNSIKFIFSKKNILKNICKFFLKIITNLLPDDFFAKKIDKISQKYSFSDCEYAGVIAWGNGLKERFEKKYFEDYYEYFFEGKKFRGLKNYDEYLTSLYGNYMQLPPVEKRVTHNFIAWRVEQNEKD